jgi:hypothetical protein
LKICHRIEGRNGRALLAVAGALFAILAAVSVWYAGANLPVPRAPLSVSDGPDRAVVEGEVHGTRHHEDAGMSIGRPNPGEFERDGRIEESLGLPQVTIRVVEQESGAPVVSATVEAWYGGGNAGWRLLGKTSAAGELSGVVVPAGGEWIIRAKSSQGNGWRKVWGSDELEVVCLVRSPQHRHFFVVTEDRAPLPNARVYKADGEFAALIGVADLAGELQVPVDGDDWVLAQTDGQSSGWYRVAEERMTLVVQEAGLIGGTVWSRDGTAAAGADVYVGTRIVVGDATLLRSDAMRVPVTGFRCVADPQGGYSCVVPRGLYLVSARRDEEVGSAWGKVGGEEAQRLDIGLNAAAILRIEANASISHASLKDIGAPGWLARSHIGRSTSDTGIEWSVPAGRYLLTVEEESGLRHSSQCLLDPGRVKFVKVDFEGEHRFGKVVDEDGRALAAWVVYCRMGDTVRKVKTDQDGAFRMPANWRFLTGVDVAPPWGKAAVFKSTVQPDREMVVVVPRALTTPGWLHASTNPQVEGLNYYAMSEEVQQEYKGVVNFTERIGPLVAGRYVLSVEGSGRWARKVIDIVPGRTLEVMLSLSGVGRLSFPGGKWRGKVWIMDPMSGEVVKQSRIATGEGPLGVTCPEGEWEVRVVDANGAEQVVRISMLAGEVVQMSGSK